MSRQQLHWDILLHSATDDTYFLLYLFQIMDGMLQISGQILKNHLPLFPRWIIFDLKFTSWQWFCVQWCTNVNKTHLYLKISKTFSIECKGNDTEDGNVNPFVSSKCSTFINVQMHTFIRMKCQMRFQFTIKTTSHSTCLQRTLNYVWSIISDDWTRSIV